MTQKLQIWICYLYILQYSYYIPLVENVLKRNQVISYYKSGTSNKSNPRKNIFPMPIG